MLRNSCMRVLFKKRMNIGFQPKQIKFEMALTAGKQLMGEREWAITIKRSITFGGRTFM